MTPARRSFPATYHGRAAPGMRARWPTVKSSTPAWSATCAPSSTQTNRPGVGSMYSDTNSPNFRRPMKQMPALLRRRALGSPARSARARTSALVRSPTGKRHRRSASPGTCARKYDWSLARSSPLSKATPPPGARRSRA